jgi:hypothetical protein
MFTISPISTQRSKGDVEFTSEARRLPDAYFPILSPTLILVISSLEREIDICYRSWIRVQALKLLDQDIQVIDQYTHTPST